MTLPENPTEDEYQAWLADPETPPLPDLQWAHRVVTNELPFCGCGRPEDAWEWLRGLLDLFDRDGRSGDDAWRGRWAAIKAHVGMPEDTGDEAGFDVVRSGAAEMLLNLPDSAGLTEHGGSVYGSWLTDKGERFLAVMRKVRYDDLSAVGYPEPGTSMGAYELIGYGGAWMIRKVTDKTLVWKGYDEEAAVARLAQMNGTSA